MQPCIYCRIEFDEAEKEHVIHAFLGTKWKDGKLICHACQTAFANGIDTTMSNRLQPFRLLLKIEGDHGGTGKKITDLLATSGETIDLGPGGKPILRKPYVTVTEGTGDRYKVSIKVGRDKDIDWALSDVRKILPHAKLDSKEIKKLGVKKSERLAGEVAFDVILGGKDMFRAVLKCCANLFGAHHPAARAAFLDPVFNPAREFVLNGTGADGDFVRWMVSGEPQDLPARGPADQSIILTTRGGSVEGVMRFFGQFVFAVRLTTNYAGPPIRCAYVVDPYREANPAEERLQGDVLAKYDATIPTFSDQSAANNAAVQAAWNEMLNRFMKHYADRENQKTVQLATDEVIRRDPQIAAMPRAEVVEKMRKLIEKRFDRFEQTGDATGITTVGSRPKAPEKPAEGADDNGTT